MVSRRRVVQGLGALGLLGGAARAADLCPAPGLPHRFCFEAAPFPLGVASGDPQPRSVILWTRLAANPVDPAGQGGLDGQITVDWVVARDPALRDVAAQGRVAVGAEQGYALHVDVRGLRPATAYWYRFAAGGRASRIGRTRTAPDAAASRVRFAGVSCQDFVARYGAYADLARQPLDFVLHLGDTIYEGAVDGRAAADLPAYRYKHALFRADPLAREAWAAHPFVVTWDDHEVLSDYCGADPAHDARRRDGYRAFYEHMPLRPPAGLPADWKDLRLYRRLEFGALLELAVLDLRQYRDRRAAGADEAARPGRTLLGAAQKRWLLDRLRAGSAAWTCIGSPVFMADYGGNLDAWDGFAHERATLLRAVGEQRRHRVVVASGDWHRSVAARLLAGAGPRFDAGDAAVAVNFGVPALSSKARRPERPDPDAGFAPRPAAPWVLYEDDGYRGYVLCEVTPEAWRATYRVLRHGAADCLTTLAAFTVNRAGEIVSSGFVPFRC